MHLIFTKRGSDFRSGKQAAAIMSLIMSARMNGHDPCTCLKDALNRLPKQQANETIELICSTAERCKMCWADAYKYSTRAAPLK
ncbi:transposase domain-containing protein [Pseudomonas viridiflava]|nr:transposase domain-containing protein [Pseudomonas viridiflava]